MEYNNNCTFPLKFGDTVISVAFKSSYCIQELSLLRQIAVKCPIVFGSDLRVPEDLRLTTPLKWYG